MLIRPGDDAEYDQWNRKTNQAGWDQKEVDGTKHDDGLGAGGTYRSVVFVERMAGCRRIVFKEHGKKIIHNVTTLLERGMSKRCYVLVKPMLSAKFR